MFLYSLKHKPTGLYDKEYVSLHSIKCTLAKMEKDEQRNVDAGVYKQYPDAVHINVKDYEIEEFHLDYVNSYPTCDVKEI